MDDVFQNLIDDLRGITPEDCKRLTIGELQDLCDNPVFHLLCDYCKGQEHENTHRGS